MGLITWRKYNMTFIHGWTGNHNPDTAANRGKNTGEKVAQMAKEDPASLLNADIQYTTRDETGNFSIEGGLAYAMASLDALDADGDGIVKVDEAGTLGAMIDLNNDGVVSASENLSYTMFQDFAGNADGIVTAEEAALADQALVNDPNGARQQMGNIHQQFDLGNREAQLNNQQAFNDQLQQFDQWLQEFVQSNYENGFLQSPELTYATEPTQPTNQAQDPTFGAPPAEQQNPMQQFMQYFMQQMLGIFMMMMSYFMQQEGQNNV